MADEALPEGWVAYTDLLSQSIYYENETTGETSWGHPGSPGHGGGGEGHGWEEHQDPSSGSPYYVHKRSGSSIWERPAELDSVLPPAPPNFSSMVEKVPAIADATLMLAKTVLEATEAVPFVGCVLSAISTLEEMNNNRKVSEGARYANPTAVSNVMNTSCLNDSLCSPQDNVFFAYVLESLCVSVKDTLTQISEDGDFMKSQDHQALRKVGQVCLTTVKWVINYRGRHWSKLFFKSSKYKGEMKDMNFSIDQALKALMAQYQVFQRKMNQRNHEEHMAAFAKASNSKDMSSAVERFEKDAVESKKKLIKYKILLVAYEARAKSQAKAALREKKNFERTLEKKDRQNNDTVAELETRQAPFLQEEERWKKKLQELEVSMKVSEANTQQIKEQVTKAKDAKIEELKKQLAEMAVKDSAPRAQEISEEEAEISELVLSAEPELEADIDEEGVLHERGASSAMDELLSKGNTPEEAMELLKELGARCGWSVSPDGFVVDSELALALHDLLSKIRELVDEATHLDTPDDEADEKFKQSDLLWDKFQEIEARHRNIMLSTAGR